MEKFTIKNRYGLDIVGFKYTPENPSGLAFVLHGLGGFKEQATMTSMADVFLKNNYIVINFDATNSIGESGGKYEDATMQKHYEDLVDVIEWTKKQTWYMEPFILSGHSLGGFATAKYSEDYPEKVKGVFPFALVVAGELSFKASELFKQQEIKEWKETGWTTRTSSSKPGIIMKLPWSHMEERLIHDLRPDAFKLTMPVLLLVGDKDESCPPDSQKILFDLLPKNSNNEFHIIPEAPHTFRIVEHLEEMKNILDKWVKKIK